MILQMLNQVSTLLNQLTPLLNGLTFLVLLVTLIVLIRYTRYTYQMKEQAKKQVEAANKQTEELIYQRRLEGMPAFNGWLVGKAGKLALQLHNIGNGVAADLTIEPIRAKSDLGADCILKFDFMPFVRPGDVPECLSPQVSYDHQLDRSPHIIDVLDPLRSALTDKGTHILILRFQDIEGACYLQHLVLSEDPTKLRYSRPVQEHKV
jgi:hypothetical protein